jgi:hypothetical protein
VKRNMASSSSAIEILVEPIQSAFFAGEPLTVHVTFKNTLPSPPSATPPAGPYHRLYANGRGHRSALSLAAPPQTVPLPRSRTPGGAEIKTAVASILGTDDERGALPTRQGLVGKPPPGSPPSTPRRSSPSSDAAGLYGTPRRTPSRQGHRKNVYSIAPGGVEDMSSVLAAERQTVDVGHIRKVSSNGSPLSGKGAHVSFVGPECTQVDRSEPAVPPSIREEGAGPESERGEHQYALASSPSARRSSFLSQPSPSTVSPSDLEFDSSTPRTSVDFYNLGQGANDTMDSVMRDGVTDSMRRPSRRRSSSIVSMSGYDLSSPSPSSSSATVNGYSPPQSNRPDAATQTLLWTFAHFEGQFEVDESLIKPAEFIAVKHALFGERGGMVGGGSMGGEDKSKSWLGDTRGSLEERRNRALGDRSVPILRAPPSILGVDIRLRPGEKKTCESPSLGVIESSHAQELFLDSFSVVLPGDLPPSFRGRSIKFSYSLVIGINRSPSAMLGEKTQQSRVVRVPMRIYNNVSGERVLSATTDRPDRV